MAISSDTNDFSARQRWMGLLARSETGRVRTLFEQLALAVETSDLRAPEVGMVMVRGRMGATGAPFNLGEMTVTRASVQLVLPQDAAIAAAGAVVGHAYVQGRRPAHARLAATVDALMVAGQHTAEIEAGLLAPLEADETARRADAVRAAEDTRVSFFTMVRSE